MTQPRIHGVFLLLELIPTTRNKNSNMEDCSLQNDRDPDGEEL